MPVRNWPVCTRSTFQNQGTNDIVAAGSPVHVWGVWVTAIATVAGNFSIRDNGSTVDLFVFPMGTAAAPSGALAWFPAAPFTTASGLRLVNTATGGQMQVAWSPAGVDIAAF